MPNRLAQDAAQHGFAGWLAGPVGAFVSRIVIGCIALIGTILGWVVTNSVANISANIGTLTVEVRALSEQIGTLKISVALTAEQAHQLESRLATIEAMSRNQEGRLGLLEGRISFIQQQRMK